MKNFNHEQLTRQPRYKNYIHSKSPWNTENFYHVLGHRANLNKLQVLQIAIYPDYYARKLDVKNKISQE